MCRLAIQKSRKQQPLNWAERPLVGRPSAPGLPPLSHRIFPLPLSVWPLPSYLFLWFTEALVLCLPIRPCEFPHTFPHEDDQHDIVVMPAPRVPSKLSRSHHILANATCKAISAFPSASAFDLHILSSSPSVPPNHSLCSTPGKGAVCPALGRRGMDSVQPRTQRPPRGLSCFLPFLAGDFYTLTYPFFPPPLPAHTQPKLSTPLSILKDDEDSYPHPGRARHRFCF